MTRLSSLFSSPTFRLCAALFLAGCGSEGEEASGAPLQEPDALEAEAPPAEEGFDLSEMGHNEGSEETSILGVVEFSDFGCTYCAQFHLESYPDLNSEFVATGDILWKYIPISIIGATNGNLAGASGICAQELGSFPRMRDHLFARREEWLFVSSANATDTFVRLAGEAGLDQTAFRACLESPEPHATLEANNQMARQIGISATPSFIIAGSIVRGLPPLDSFQTGLRNILAEIRRSEAEETEEGEATP